MAFTTIFTDEIIEHYTKEGYWGRGTLLDHFERNAAKFPEREYVIDVKERVSFAKMSKIVDNVAGRLLDLGFKKEDRIAVMLPNWVEFFYMQYAIEKIGGISVPLLMNLREWEVEYVLNTTETAGLVIPDFFNKFDYVGMMSQMRGKVNSLQHIFVIGNDVKEGILPFAELTEAKPDREYDAYRFDTLRTVDTDVYIIGMTSGTTSRPKLYLYTENGHVTGSYVNKEKLRLTENDVMLGLAPITQGFGRSFGFSIPSITGCRTVLQEKFDPAISLQLIEKEKVTVIAAVPTQSIKMLSQPELEHTDLSSLRAIMHSGARLPSSVAHEVEEKFGCKVLNCYAASDGPRVSCTNLDDPSEVRYETVGKPYAGHEIKIIGQHGEKMAIGEIGEIWSKGPTISGGYYKESPEVMKETFLENGWFRHGDLATVREDGNIVITGRCKDLIIRGGQNIAPKEIEDILLTHPKVKGTAVVGVPDSVLGEKVCAFAVTRNLEDPLTFHEMIDFLTTRKLAKFKFPEVLEVIDDLPVSGGEKIDKNALREKISRKLKKEEVL